MGIAARMPFASGSDSRHSAIRKAPLVAHRGAFVLKLPDPYTS